MKDTWWPKVYFSRLSVFKVYPGILTKVACGSKVDKDGVGVSLCLPYFTDFFFFLTAPNDLWNLSSLTRD